jgi:hypothetical protein
VQKPRLIAAFVVLGSVYAGDPILSAYAQQQAACDVAAEANTPTCVRARSADVKQHPERATLLECAGLKAYEDPQPQGHPVALAECDRLYRQIQQKKGLPVTGLSSDQIDAYNKTWESGKEAIPEAGD